MTRETRAVGSGPNRSRRLFAFSLFFAITVGLASYFKNEGIRDLIHHDNKLERQRWVVKKLKAENSLLRRKITAVHDDSYLIEKFAREKLRLAKNNEIVFRFYEKTDVFE